VLFRRVFHSNQLAITHAALPPSCNFLSSPVYPVESDNYNIALPLNDASFPPTPQQQSGAKEDFMRKSYPLAFGLGLMLIGSAFFCLAGWHLVRDGGFEKWMTSRGSTTLSSGLPQTEKNNGQGKGKRAQIYVLLGLGFALDTAGAALIYFSFRFGQAADQP